MAFIQAPFRPLQQSSNIIVASSPARMQSGPVMAASPMSRRSVLRLATLSVGTLLLAGTGPADVHAISLREKAASDALGRIRLGKTKALELKKIAMMWGEKIKDEDIGLVLRFIPIWLTPARVACTDLPNLVDPKKADTDKLATQALLMTGHLLELSTEAKSGNTKGIIRELDEIAETVDDISAIAKNIG